ncbi:MAG: flagellar hook-basal body complex protein FliE [Ignavibacteriota bacterium]
MSFAISPIASIAPVAGAPATSATAKTGSAGNFSSFLEGAIQSVEQPGAQADQAVQSFLNGENEDIHTVALATQKASLAFDLGMQMRNKVVAAYQEVMKMQM